MWCDVEDEHSYTLALTLPPQGSGVTRTSTRTGCPSARAPATLCSVPMASGTGDSYVGGAKPPAHCAYVPTEGGGRGGSRREGNAKAKSLIDECVVTDVNDCTYQACCRAIATSAVRLPDTGTYVQWVFRALRDALPLIISTQHPVLIRISRRVKVDVKMSRHGLRNNGRRWNVCIGLPEVPGSVAASGVGSK